jgi:hypothetical protein
MLCIRNEVDMRHSLLLLPLILAACGPGAETANDATDNPAAVTGNAAAPEDDGAADDIVADEAPAPGPSPAPLDPPAPGEPGGLDDDRTPIDESPQPEASGQGAARVVERYYGLIEAGRYAQAYQLWEPGRAGMNAQAFARSFDRYAEYHANIGAPGEIEGAAGSRFVTVPVQPYGRLKAGNRAFNMRGTITLRRVAEVPGSTAAQRRWRIHGADIKPRPSEAAPTPAPQPTEDNRSTAQYRCDGGVRLTARFDPDRGRVTVLRGGERLARLQQQRAASGIWYRGNGYELRGKGRQITFTAPGAKPLSCEAQLP